MQIDQLLIRRFILENAYPGCQWDIGTILMQHKGFDKIIFAPEYHEDGMDVISIQALEKYPYLFRELKWWEHRKEDDLPHYVKCIWDAGDYLKKDEIGIVVGWNLKKGNEIVYINTVGNACWLKRYIPATEAEFLEQNKAKTLDEVKPIITGTLFQNTITNDNKEKK